MQTIKRPGGLDICASPYNCRKNHKSDGIGYHRGMKKNILLVDDSPADVEFTCHVLKSCEVDHEVTIHRDGEEAVRRLEEDTGIDLVLLDLKLPKVDGFDVLAHAAADSRIARIPIIVVSTSALDVDVTRAARLGAAGYIVKSMDFGEFRHALKAELSKHMAC